MEGTSEHFQRPEPPAGARNLVMVVLDSLRYDSWLAAEPANLARLGTVERRFSYASWTAPSHYNMLMGLLPHTSPPAFSPPSTTRRISSATTSASVSRASSSAACSRRSTCRRSSATSSATRRMRCVSMPVLNAHTAINRDFDSFELMPTHNDMRGDAPEAAVRATGRRSGSSTSARRTTRTPCRTRTRAEWPRISGVHGVLKRWTSGRTTRAAVSSSTKPQLDSLRQRQVAR